MKSKLPMVALVLVSLLASGCVQNSLDAQECMRFSDTEYDISPPVDGYNIVDKEILTGFTETVKHADGIERELKYTFSGAVSYSDSNGGNIHVHFNKLYSNLYYTNIVGFFEQLPEVYKPYRPAIGYLRILNRDVKTITLDFPPNQEYTSFNRYYIFFFPDINSVLYFKSNLKVNETESLRFIMEYISNNCERPVEVLDGALVVGNETNEDIVMETDDCKPEWSCTEWSECLQSNQKKRICNDLNNCNNTKGKPIESSSCDYTKDYVNPRIKMNESSWKLTGKSCSMPGFDGCRVYDCSGLCTFVFDNEFGVQGDMCGTFSVNLWNPLYNTKSHTCLEISNTTEFYLHASWTDWDGSCNLIPECGFTFD